MPVKTGPFIQIKRSSDLPSRHFLLQNVVWKLSYLTRYVSVLILVLLWKFHQVFGPFCWKKKVFPDRNTPNAIQNSRLEIWFLYHFHTNQVAINLLEKSYTKSPTEWETVRWKRNTEIWIAPKFGCPTICISYKLHYILYLNKFFCDLNFHRSFFT